MSEYENVVTLTDEDGIEVDFEILDIVPYEGGEYAVLLPVDDESDVVDAEILSYSYLLQGKFPEHWKRKDGTDAINMKA